MTKQEAGPLGRYPHKPLRSPRYIESLDAEPGGGQCGAQHAFIDWVVVPGQLGIAPPAVVRGRSLGSFAPAAFVWIDRAVDGDEQAALDEHPRGLWDCLVELGVVQRRNVDHRVDA